MVENDGWFFWSASILWVLDLKYSVGAFDGGK
jgi:hypothetical protein